MTDLHTRFRFIFVAAACLVPATVVAASAAPFNELHCYKIKDAAVNEAAVAFIESGSEIAESCTLKNHAVRACVPVRSTEPGTTPEPDSGEGSLVFDRLCYRVSCDGDDGQDTASVTDRFGSHEFTLADQTTLCLPAVLGDIDEFISRGDGDATKRARKRAAGLSPGIDLFTCGDFNGDGSITATDALGILRTAVGSETCPPCVCDVDMSETFTATDALAALRNAVGLLAELGCQPDGTVVTWDGGGDGTSWSDPANWSIETRIPNICEVVSIASGAVVTVEHDSGTNSALSVTSGFPLDMDGGSLTLRDTIQVNNTFTFTGGELVDATIVASGAPLKAGLTANGQVATGPVFSSSQGTLDNCIVNAPMDLSAGSARANIQNGLTLNDTATLGASAQLYFEGGDNPFDGTGEVIFTSTSQGFVNTTTNTNLTIGSGITIRGTAGRVGSATATATVTNNGVIHSDQTGRIDIEAGGGWTNENQVLASNGGSLRLMDTWTNNSLISISGGGTLELEGDWHNAGTITSSDSTVEFDGEFFVADIGTFTRSGGTVELRGILDNVLALVLDSTTGSWEMRGGTILGGGVSTADGAEFIFTSSQGTLDGVTFNAPMNMTSGSARANIVNNLMLNDTATMGSSAQLYFNGGTQTLEGTGEVVMNSASQSFVNTTSNTALTIADGMTIRGMAGRIGSSTATSTVTNEGIIHSDATGRIDIQSGGGWTNENQILASNGGSLRLFDTWTNNSLISITGGGTLELDGLWENDGTISSTDSTVELDGEFSLSTLGTFNRSGGTVELRGIFDNVVSLNLNSTTGSWEMRGGTILGGGVTATDGAELIFTSSQGTLDGVTFNAPMNMTSGSARANIINSLTLNDTATMGSSAQLYFNGGTQTLQGTGEVVMSSASQSFVNTTSNTNLSIGSDITIRGKAGRIGSSTATSTVTIDGTVDSDEVGRIDIQSGGGWTNEGTVMASNGGSLRLFDSWTNNSLISITGGGTLELDGLWENDGTIASTDSTVSLDGEFSISALGTFNRTGGTVELRGIFDNIVALNLNAATGSWEMRGGTILGGGVTTADGAEFIFTSSQGTLNGVTFNAPMNMTSGSARANIINNLTLNDTATMGSSAQLYFNGGTQTVDGTGEVVMNSASQSFVNTTTNTNLTIASGITVRGKAGRIGSSNATSSVTIEGIVDSNEAGRIDIQSGGGWTNNGTLKASGGGSLRTTDTWTNNADIELGKDGSLEANSGLPLTGTSTVTIDIGGASEFGTIDVTGTATLAGTLDINLTDGFAPTTGQMFEIMTYDSMSGAFGTINATGFTVDVGASAITLTAN